MKYTSISEEEYSECTIDYIQRAIESVQSLIQMMHKADHGLKALTTSMMETSMAASPYRDYIHEALLQHPEYKYQAQYFESKRNSNTDVALFNTMARETPPNSPESLLASSSSLYTRSDKLIDADLMNRLAGKMTDIKISLFNRELSEIPVSHCVPICDDIVRFIHAKSTSKDKLSQARGEKDREDNFVNEFVSEYTNIQSYPN